MLRLRGNHSSGNEKLTIRSQEQWENNNRANLEKTFLLVRHPQSAYRLRQENHKFEGYMVRTLCQKSQQQQKKIIELGEKRVFLKAKPS